MFIYQNDQIETERFFIRHFNFDDINEVVRLCNNINVYKGTLALPYPYTIEAAKSWIETHDQNRLNQKYYDFAITDKKSGKLLGAIGLSYSQNHHHGEAGYWIGEEYWSQGIASEALSAILKYAFEILHYNRVYAKHFGFNTASGKVMQKCGLIYEGSLKKHIFKDNQYHDIECYGITVDRYVSN